MSEEILITYTFDFPKNDEPVILKLRFNKATYALIRNKSAGAVPAWTRLDSHKCEHCPLDSATMPICPVALAINDLLSQLDGILSYEKVRTVVVSPQRTITAETSVQRAFGSLFGLVIPTCGCPLTAYFRPMARFHLPFSNEEETVYRASSMYLLAQYFTQRDYDFFSLDFEGLEQIYENMHIINRQICNRLREVSTHDSSSNAIVVLDVFSMVMRTAIQRDLSLLEPYFTIYMKDE